MCACVHRDKCSHISILVCFKKNSGGLHPPLLCSLRSGPACVFVVGRVARYTFHFVFFCLSGLSKLGSDVWAT
jgi:hypothetical protein